MEIYKDPATKTHFSSRDDIPEAQERELIDRIGKIVFLVKFPKEFKSFYMGLDPEDPSYVLGCDVEVPGVGEIIGSGVRESSAERLTERLLEAKLQPADYEEYIALRKCGFCMTSGMGLGLGIGRI
jgi:asparaginyl-tRNA synthetase